VVAQLCGISQNVINFPALENLVADGELDVRGHAVGLIVMVVVEQPMAILQQIPDDEDVDG
jgi:hypothetical protein